MKNAFMVAVYAPEISVQTLKVSSLMRETLNVPENDKVRVYKELDTEAGHWPNLYFEVIKSVEAERAKCITPET
jgi:hypothetical protein